MRKSGTERGHTLLFAPNHERFVLRVVFAAGTPVSNSVTELHVMQRYLQHDMLKESGLVHFDVWASTFGETTAAIELAPETEAMLILCVSVERRFLK